MEHTNASIWIHPHILGIRTHAKGHHSALTVSLAEIGLTHTQWKVGTKAPTHTYTHSNLGADWSSIHTKRQYNKRRAMQLLKFNPN